MLSLQGKLGNQGKGSEQRPAWELLFQKATELAEDGDKERKGSSQWYWAMPGY